MPLILLVLLQMPLKLLSGYLYTTSIRYDNRVGVINALHALKGKSQALQPFARMRRSNHSHLQIQPPLFQAGLNVRVRSSTIWGLGFRMV